VRFDATARDGYQFTELRSTNTHRIRTLLLTDARKSCFDPLIFVIHRRIVKWHEHLKYSKTIPLGFIYSGPVEAEG